MKLTIKNDFRTEKFKNFKTIHLKLSKSDDLLLTLYINLYNLDSSFVTVSAISSLNLAKSKIHTSNLFAIKI